jgi:hypothetical protein
MMGGGAFDLLKTGRRRPESAKQTEIHLAILLKILQIVRFRGRKPWRGQPEACKGCIFDKFRLIWLTRRESQNLLSISQF